MCSHVWVGSGYLDAVFEPDRVIAGARRHPDRADIEFDTLVGRGMSGAPIIPVLAAALDVEYLIVGKPADSHRDAGLAEGFLGHARLFVDDFVCEGTTLRTVHDTTRAPARRHGPAHPARRWLLLPTPTAT